MSDDDRNPEHADDPAGPTTAVAVRRRRGHRKLRWLTAGALTVVLGLLVWSFAIEPRFILSEQEETATIPELGPAWAGAEVGVISDLQIGLWWDNVGMARDAVEELVERRPDVVLVLGDLIYDEADVRSEVETAVDVLRPLPESGITTLAVLGNHDHAAGGADLLLERLPAVGIEVLRNEAVALEREGESLHIAGIGPVVPGLSEPEEAVDGIPDDEPRVVMMHNPESFDGLPPGMAPLAVAGHTHGGQIRLPFFQEWSYLRFVEGAEVHTDGWIDGYGAPGNQLYVNRGIGMSVIPARLNCSPAITIFELQPA